MQSKSWFQRFFGSKSTKKSGPRAAPNIPAGTFNQTRDTASFPRFKGLSREERLRSPQGTATRTLLSRAFKEKSLKSSINNIPDVVDCLTEYFKEKDSSVEIFEYTAPPSVESTEILLSNMQTNEKIKIKDFQN